MSAIIYETDEQARTAQEEDSATVLGCASCGAKFTPASLRRLADADCPSCGAIYTSTGFMHAEAWD